MEECSVCSDNLDDRPTRNIPCGHRFHCDCLTKWTQAGHGTCPLCRHEFQGKFRLTITIQDVLTGNATSNVSEDQTVIEGFLRRMQVL